MNVKKLPLTIDVKVHAGFKVLAMGGSKQALIRIKTEFQTLDAASRSVSINSTVHLLNEARWLDGRKERLWCAIGCCFSGQLERGNVRMMNKDE